MKIIIQRLLLLLVLVFVSSCSGTGGTVGGLIPAPKFLDGKVEGDTYYSAEGAFKVQLPHLPSRSKDDEYEWTYTKVHEIKDKGVVGVVFGPAAFDLNQYHAVLIRAPMKNPKEEYVKTVFRKKIESRGGMYTQKEFKNFEVNGKQSFYGVYESTNALLVLSLTDNGDSFYAVEADVPRQSKEGATTIMQLINREWDIFNNMLNTFTVLNPVYKN